MQSTTSYSASAELVRRAGLEKDRYMTRDGRFVISEGDLRFMASRGVITAEEFVNGLDVVMITPEERAQLIMEGGYNTTGEPLPEQGNDQPSASSEDAVQNTES